MLDDLFIHDGELSVYPNGERFQARFKIYNGHSYLENESSPEEAVERLCQKVEEMEAS